MMMKVSEWATKEAEKTKKQISFDRKLVLITFLAAGLIISIMTTIDSARKEPAQAQEETFRDREFGSVEYNLLSDRIAYLEDNIRNLEKEKSDLEKEISDLNMSTSYLKGYVTTLNKKINSNTARIRNHVK